ncbi:hypothetical protein MP228_012641 [Amoeboaphelidium protococcarum]|nr:hypothetical protein MP228_012641 [Amoeboaphelidium protococcarum]
MSLESYLASKSRDRHFTEQGSDVCLSEFDEKSYMSFPENDLYSVKSPSRKSRAGSKHNTVRSAIVYDEDDVEYNDGMKDEQQDIVQSVSFSGWAYRRSIMVNKKLFVRADGETFKVYKDEYAVSPSKEYRYVESQVISKDSLKRYELHLNGDVYCFKQKLDRDLVMSLISSMPRDAQIVDDSDESRLYDQTIMSPFSASPVNQASATDVDGFGVSSRSLQCNESAVAISAYQQHEKQQVLYNENVANAICNQSDNDTKACIVDIQNQVSALSSIISTHQQQSLGVVQGSVEEQRASFVLLKQKIDSIAASIEKIESKKGNEQSSVSDFVQLNRCIQSISAEIKRIPVSDNRQQFEAVSDSLSKILEYLSKTVDIQNLSDASFHSKLDSIIDKLAMQTAKSPQEISQISQASVQLDRIEAEVVNISRSAMQQQSSASSHQDLAGNVVKQINMLQKVLQGFEKQDSAQSADMNSLRSDVEGMKNKLSQLLSSVGTYPQSTNLVVKDVQQAVSEVKAILHSHKAQSDITPLSPQVVQDTARARSVSPSKLNGHDTFTVVNHLLDLSKNVNALRTQLNNYNLQTNTNYKNLNQTMTTIQQKSTPKVDNAPLLDAFKESKEQILSAIHEGLVDSVEQFAQSQQQISKNEQDPRFKVILEEIEHLQYGFQNQMTGFKKMLQSVTAEKEALAKDNAELKAKLSQVQLPHNSAHQDSAVDAVTQQIKVLLQQKNQLQNDVERELAILSSIKEINKVNKIVYRIPANGVRNGAMLKQVRRVVSFGQ